MELHHMAIATSNLYKMKEFYLKLPNSKLIQETFYENKKLHSVWIELAHNAILMLEDRNYNKAPEALIFQFPKEVLFQDLQKQFQFFEATQYTVYFLDPDKNKLGFSSYPQKLTEFFTNEVIYEFVL